MTNLIGIYDHTTGEQIVREMTADELSEFNAQSEAYKAEKLAKENEANELRAIKISAYQKLGLTQQEIDALIPPDAEPIVKNG